MNKAVVILKLILIVLLIGCLAPMPYGYFMGVRFFVMLCMGIFAWQYYIQKQPIFVWICIAIGILFQPVFKINLGRFIWNIADVILAITLLASILIPGKRNT